MFQKEICVLTEFYDNYYHLMPEKASEAKSNHYGNSGQAKGTEVELYLSSRSGFTE